MVSRLISAAPCQAATSYNEDVDVFVDENVEVFSENSDTLPDFVRVTTLEEVEVRGGRQKYSKKNNPAYELMKRIRATKDLNDPRMLPEYTEDYYSKLVLGLNDCDASEFRGKDKLKFLNEYVDTAAHTGLPVLLVSLKEKAGIKVHSLNFTKDKDIVKGERSVGVDDEFNKENVTKFLEDVLRDVDIYNDDINIMQNRFVSPISRLSDDYYRFYLNDTAVIDGKQYNELTFSPRTPQSFGFNGRMFVECGDSTYFIKRIEMRVPRVINLNYIDNIYITQEYYKDRYGKRHLKFNDMSLEISLIPGTQSLYARRYSTFGEPQFSDANNLHNILYDASELIVYKNPNLQPWDKWEDFRLIPLSKAEGEMGSFMSRMRKYPLIYWGEKILKIIVQGYVSTGRNSKVDLGPINTLISYNSIEGVRFRVGGLTTANLSPHWFARGYVAYGCRDRKVKYNAELEYSFLAKQYHSREFPVNSIRLQYNYDLDLIGQHYVYTNSDNVFLSLKRKGSHLAFYKREASATYQLELQNHFSVIGQFSHKIYDSTRWTPLVNAAGAGQRSFRMAGFHIELRYSPGEKFYQTSGTRYAVNKDAPVILLTHDIVPAGMLGSDYTLNKTELSLGKRFWFSAFGYADVILKGGKIWSRVQYPSLLWQNANLSFTIQPESYSLMNPMEFPMDYYGSLDLTYFANGALFNRIPYFNKLKLREVVTFKGLMGGLTAKNDPDKNPELWRFPEGAATARLSSTPYMELGVGIDNILTCLRIDYIWRLTYRHVPDATRSGLRVSLHFSF